MKKGHTGKIWSYSDFPFMDYAESRGDQYVKNTSPDSGVLSNKYFH